MNRLRFSRWLLGGALAIHVPIAFIAATTSHYRSPDTDFDNYYTIGTKPGRPYVDFPVEFPLASVEAFRTLARMAGTYQRFSLALVFINVAADFGIAGILAWAWGTEAAAVYAVVAAPLLDLFLLRMDLWSVACATMGVAAWRHGFRKVAGVSFVGGAALKLWPLMFLPLLVVPSRACRRTDPLATAAAAGVALLGVWLWVAGPRGLSQVVTFRGATGWHIESTVGGVWMLIDRGSMRLESGAWRIGATRGPISILLFALGTVLCWWIVWRSGRTGHRHLGVGWAGGLSALLVCSPLLSPQFACWLAPAAGIAWVEDDTRIAVLTALAVFLSNLVFKSSGPLLRGESRALVLVNARMLLLAVLAFEAARDVVCRSDADSASDQLVDPSQTVRHRPLATGLQSHSDTGKFDGDRA